MQDLCSGSATLDSFKVVVFVGGFSYADVLGSAKGKQVFIVSVFQNNRSQPFNSLRPSS